MATVFIGGLGFGFRILVASERDNQRANEKEKKTEMESQRQTSARPCVSCLCWKAFYQHHLLLRKKVHRICQERPTDKRPSSLALNPGTEIPKTVINATTLINEVELQSLKNAVFSNTGTIKGGYPRDVRKSTMLPHTGNDVCCKAQLQAVPCTECIH